MSLGVACFGRITSGGVRTLFLGERRGACTRLPCNASPVPASPVPVLPCTRLPCTRAPLYPHPLYPPPLYPPPLYPCSLVPASLVLVLPCTRLPCTRLPCTRLPCTRLPCTRAPLYPPPLYPCSPVPASPVPVIPCTRLPCTRLPCTRAPLYPPPCTRLPCTRAPLYPPPLYPSPLYPPPLYPPPLYPCSLVPASPVPASLVPMLPCTRGRAHVPWVSEGGRVWARASGVAMTVLTVPDRYLPTTVLVSAAKDTSPPTDVDTRRPASKSDRPEKKARKAGEAGAEEGTPRPFQPMDRVPGVDEVSWLDKDQEQSAGWDTSMLLDGVQYLRVSFRNQVTCKLRKVYEPLEAVLAWNEHDPVEHAQWVRTINEEVVAKRGSWKCLGDGSALPVAVVTPGLAGVAAAASKVQQRFKHLQRYACAAFALFNVLDAPRQYNKKMRTFKKSIKSLAVFFEFVDWLRSPDLVVCRQPVVARSLNKLLEPTQGLALVTKGTHCFGIDLGDACSSTVVLTTPTCCVSQRCCTKASSDKFVRAKKIYRKKALAIACRPTLYKGRPPLYKGRSTLYKGRSTLYKGRP
eukprot:g13710.t1